MTPVPLRDDFDSAGVRCLASGFDDADHVRRLLSIAAVYDGISRADAARIGGLDRQSLRDWVHRFNGEGPAGLIDRKAPGAPAKLAAPHLTELAAVVETGPDPVANGVVRWRCMDYRAWIEVQFGVVYHERSVSRLLNELGFSPISARPRHAGQTHELATRIHITEDPKMSKNYPNEWPARLEEADSLAPLLDLLRR